MPSTISVKYFFLISNLTPLSGSGICHWRQTCAHEILLPGPVRNPYYPPKQVMLGLHTTRFHLISVLGDHQFLLGCSPVLLHTAMLLSSLPAPIPVAQTACAGADVKPPPLEVFSTLGMSLLLPQNLLLSQSWDQLEVISWVTPHPNFGFPRAASSTSCICLPHWQLPQNQPRLSRS